MSELFETEGQSIFAFKTGDIIIKINPRVIMKQQENENLGIVTEVKVGIDNSFREPLEFIAVRNNIIYLRDLKEDALHKAKKVRTGHLEDYSEGWALFVVPNGLTIHDCI